MADNVTTDPGSGGAGFVTREITHAGDASQHLSGIFLMGISGSEGSYTVGAIDGTAANGLDVDVTRIIPGVSATHLGKAEDAVHVSADTGVAVLGVRRDTAAVGSDTDGDYSTLNVDASGRLWSHDPVSAALLTTIDADTSSMNTDLSTLAGAVSGTEIQVDLVSAAVTNAGTFAVQVDGAALTALQLIDDAVYADDDAFTLTSSKVFMSGAIRDDVLTTLTAVEGDVVPLRVDANGALHVNSSVSSQYAEDVAHSEDDLGTMALAVRNDTLATLTSTDGDYSPLQVDALGALFTTVDSISAGSALIGDVGLSGARTSGGTTFYKNLDVDESEDAIKASAGQVYWIHAMNLSAAKLYLKLYNATVATVVVGTTVPDLTFPVATAADTNGVGFVLSVPNGIEFGTAITIACTTGPADNNSGAPGANEMIVNMGYA